MSVASLNLARAPFANRRPLRRLTVVLWILAGILFVANARLYWQHFSGKGEQQADLVDLQAGIAAEQQGLDSALAEFASYDIDWQRDQIDYLNGKIAERTFAWSALFDHLTEVLPPTVLLERVTPQLVTRGAGRRQAAKAMRSASDEVLLVLNGRAEDDDILYTFVDNFFAHERFRRPDWEFESRDTKGGEVKFSLSVVYLPVPPVPPAKADAKAPAEASGAGEAAEVASETEVQS